MNHLLIFKFNEKTPVVEGKIIGEYTTQGTTQIHGDYNTWNPKHPRIKMVVSDLFHGKTGVNHAKDLSSLILFE